MIRNSSIRMCGMVLERQVNSYVLQVEPKRHMMKDKLSVDYWEALHIEKIRNNFFTQLKKLVQDLIDSG